MMRPAIVLIIDDLESLRDALAEILRDVGYQVVTAASVLAAEAIHEHLGPTGLDLVITNLRLTRHPHAREGADLILRWHALAPDLPFILMSGDLRPHDTADVPLKVVWYLSKPFTAEVLLNTVQEAMRS